MALATNSTPGSIVLAGDLTGTANTPELRVTGVTPGSYTAPDIVVDSKGRVLSATESTTTFAGDMTGTRSATTLKASGVTAGTYTNANPTINSQGLVTGVTGGGLTLNGMLTGGVSSNVLAPTGVTPGTYNYVGITVDSTGRVMSVNTTVPPGYNISSYSVNGIVQVTQDLGLTVSSGNLSGTMATSSVFGVIKTADSSNINITTGTVNVGSNVPTLSGNTTFGKSINHPTGTLSASTDLSTTNTYQLLPGTTTLGTNNEQPGDVFDFYSQNTGPYFTIPTPTTGIDQPANQNELLWLAQIRYVGGRFVSSDSRHYTYSSVNGTDWSASYYEPVLMHVEDIKYSNSKWVSLTMNKSSDNIHYRIFGSNSTDGLNWSPFPDVTLDTWTYPSSDWCAVSPTTMVCVVENTTVYLGQSTQANTMTSTDSGATWTKTFQPQFHKKYIGACSWTGTRFLVWTSAGNYTSPDGVTWTASSTGTPHTKAYYIGNEVWLYDTPFSALGGIGSYDPVLWYSVDGGSTFVALSISFIGGNVTSVITHGNYLVINNYWASLDRGITWYPIYAPGGGALVSTGVDLVRFNHTGVSNTEGTVCQATPQFPVTWSPEFKFSNTSTSGSPHGTCVRGTDGINYCTYKG